MNKETPSKPPVVDREAVRVLAIELGVREAARRCGLSEDRVRKWSSRYKWLEQRTPKQKEAVVTIVTKPGDVLIAHHQRLEGQTRTGLSKAAATAATHAGEMEGNNVLSHSSQLRNITHVATKVFGWDRKEKPEVQVNQLVISPEACEALREIDRDDQMSEERRSELYHKIQAGVTGRVTAEQMKQIQEACQAQLKPGEIGYVAQPDKERAVPTGGEQAREP